jgi:hypothetical protein
MADPGGGDNVGSTPVSMQDALPHSSSTPAFEFKNPLIMQRDSLRVDLAIYVSTRRALNQNLEPCLARNETEA